MQSNFNVGRRLLGRAAVFFLLFSGAARGDDLGYRTDMLEDGTLGQWIVTHCQVRLQEGVLHALEGEGLVRSVHRYRDFRLQLEWKPEKQTQFDAGIYIRCDDPKVGQKWPARYQINLKENEEGSLIGVPAATVRGLARADDWNHLDLTVQGARARLLINHQLAWAIDDLEGEEGFIGIQVETPLGGAFQYRKIVVTELQAHDLLQGLEDQWEGAGAPAQTCWSLQDGVLRCSGAPGPWLRLRESVGDFCLRMEYRLQPSGNSGVYVRVPPDGAHHGPGAGLEVQILDHLAAQHADLRPYQYTGSLYAIRAAEPRKAPVLDRWNALEIECRGSHYRVWNQGVLVVDTDAQKSPELAQRRGQGFIGLQNHRTEVLFRHVRLERFE